MTDTSTKATCQKAAILAHLRQHGHIDSPTSRTLYGCAVELARLVINPEKTSEASALAVQIILKKSLYSDWLAIAGKDLK